MYNSSTPMADLSTQTPVPLKQKQVFTAVSNYLIKLVTCGQLGAASKALLLGQGAPRTQNSSPKDQSQRQAFLEDVWNFTSLGLLN